MTSADDKTRQTMMGTRKMTMMTMMMMTVLGRSNTVSCFCASPSSVSLFTCIPTFSHDRSFRNDSNSKHKFSNIPSLRLSSDNDDMKDYYDDNDKNNNDDNEKNNDREKNNDNDNFRSNVDAMRQILESSWDTQTMGIVPTTPESAASAAAESISEAVADRETTLNNIFLVDIGLPSYDAAMGPGVYDDVAAVEFCTELAKCLKERGLVGEHRRSAVLVRDLDTVHSAGRVLAAREKREEMDRRRDLLENSLDLDVANDDADQDVKFYNDFADFGNDDDDNNDGNNDKDALRQQLMSSWDLDDTTNTNTNTNIDSIPSQNQPKNNPTPEPSTQTPKPTQTQTPELPSKAYRLGSMLGDGKVSTGPDMIQDIVNKIKTHGMPSNQAKTEDAIIILCPMSQAEMVAVRTLVANFAETKTIIIVNCKIDPVPRELIMADTVYSILPLIARSAMDTSAAAVTSNSNPNPNPNPKIVLLRRYPKDWEVHIDVNGGAGFELVDSLPAKMVGKKGPSMEWIALCTKKHMQFKFGGR